MTATSSICCLPILLLVYQTIQYTAARAGSRFPPRIHQDHFSRLTVPTPFIVTHWMEHSQLMEQKWTLECAKMRRKRILFS
jgi:hypothetical protein